MHDISPYNLDRTISISGELKEIADAEQLITEKLRQYEVCHFFNSLILASKNFNKKFQRIFSRIFNQCHNKVSILV